MANKSWRFALALWFGASGSWLVEPAAAQESTSTAETKKQDAAHAAGAPAPAQPTPTPPPRLRIDLERYIAEAIARDPNLALPRFKEDVEVRDVYQEALGARLQGVDVECGIPDSGPPSSNELNPYRGATKPPSADFTGLARLIGNGLKNRGAKPRYFLYAVSREPTTVAASTASAVTPPGATAAGPAASAPPAAQAASVTYVLRDSPVPENARSSVPGTSWTLVASFRDRQPALATMDRLRRASTPETSDVRLPVWTTCRPPRGK